MTSEEYSHNFKKKIVAFNSNSHVDQRFIIET
jgi:hypothetical protein